MAWRKGCRGELIAAPRIWGTTAVGAWRGIDSCSEVDDAGVSEILDWAGICLSRHPLAVVNVDEPGPALYRRSHDRLALAAAEIVAGVHQPMEELQSLTGATAVAMTNSTLQQDRHACSKTMQSAAAQIKARQGI